MTGEDQEIGVGVAVGDAEDGSAAGSVAHGRGGGAAADVPRPRERERWHAVWLLAQGWTAAAVARALERDAHTIGQWARAFAEGGPKLGFTHNLEKV